MAVILRYFSEFGYLPGVLRKSSRSLSHLLMSSCRILSESVNELHSFFERTRLASTSSCDLSSELVAVLCRGSRSVDEVADAGADLRRNTSKMACLDGERARGVGGESGATWTTIDGTSF